MKLENIIYDILEIKHAVHDDADIDEMWLAQKINAYRSMIIKEEYARNPIIDSSWLQRLPNFDFQKVLSGDDPNILWGSVTLGKYRVPKVISLAEEQGFYNVFNASRGRPLSMTDFATLMIRLQLNEDLAVGAGWYATVGQDLYVYPYIMKGTVHLIAEDPMSIPILDEDGNPREFSYDDDYPIDAGTAQRIILEILTKDLNIYNQQISDVVNDAQSQLKILRSYTEPQTK